MRVRTKRELAECDEFLAKHGPVNGPPASYSLATFAWRSPGRGLMAVGVIQASLAHPEDALLSNCAVAPDSRGRGLQRQLIDMRVKWAKRKGYKGVRTYASVDNPASIVNLLKAGFTPTHVDTSDEGSFLYFRRAL